VEHGARQATAHQPTARTYTGANRVRARIECLPQLHLVEHRVQSVSDQDWPDHPRMQAVRRAVYASEQTPRSVAASGFTPPRLTRKSSHPRWGIHPIVPVEMRIHFEPENEREVGADW
jgi:hypothetical protein